MESEVVKTSSPAVPQEVPKFSKFTNACGLSAMSAKITSKSKKKDVPAPVVTVAVAPELVTSRAWVLLHQPSTAQGYHSTYAKDSVVLYNFYPHWRALSLSFRLQCDAARYGGCKQDRG